MHARSADKKGNEKNDKRNDLKDEFEYDVLDKTLII